MIEQYEAARERLRKARTLLLYDQDAWARLRDMESGPENNLGELVDLRLLPAVEVIRSMIDLSDEGLASMPPQRAYIVSRLLCDPLEGINNVLAQRDASNDAPARTAVTVINGLDSPLRKLASAAWTLSPSIGAQRELVQARETANTGREALRLAESECSSIAARLAEQQSKIEELLARTEHLFRTVSISAEANHFSQASDDHARRSKVWLAAGIVIGLGMLLLTVGSILWGKGPPSATAPWYVSANLAHFAARGLLLSLLSFALVTAIRSFRSEQHNSVTNNHRARSLRTFKALLETTESDTMKEALLLQLSVALFSHQPSAFSEVAGTASHLHELAAALGASKTSGAEKA